MKTKELQPGMNVVHIEWDERTLEPLTVVEVKGKIMLQNSEGIITEPNAGGETDEGWIIFSYSNR